MSALPAVDVSSVPAIEIDSLPAVVVSSLPAVQVSSMPSVTVANSSLDVNVTNAELTVTPPAYSTVTLSDLNSVTLTAETVSQDIDVEGFRAVSIFVDCDDFLTTPTNSDVHIRVEFGAGGLFFRERSAEEPNLGGEALARGVAECLYRTDPRTQRLLSLLDE